MAFPDVSLLSDDALLNLYGRAKTNLMFRQLFKTIPKPTTEILEFVRTLSAEISDRGLDRGYEPADND